ncbi:NB-ARC domain-containing protein [Streptomyces phaeochromogenes]|uniref:NB-ARC domain-containing protein n=1 Tax=Streptomyces phaeochromogenes TaxID=1923 RepID=UPI002E0D292B|nr:NB-ARC domain-containing protein [Streptomyces phaeochromogenes]WSJ08788.1 NB-ARC domain-containing protein [Streptomyces phaeochromogenes]
MERLIGSGEGPHVVNIYGPPGVGKSALALHVAHRLQTTFQSVQLYADLGEYNGEVPTATQILQRFVADLDPSTINVPVGTRELPQRYRSLLAWQSSLILLDDARTTEQVADLVPGNTKSLVLVTSRVPLAAIAGVSLHHLDLMGLDESLSLLTAAAGRRWFAQDVDDARTLVGQCGRLPLALRIAGAILKKKSHWSPGRLVEKLSDERTRLTELVEGPLDVRSSFEVSYCTLTDDESRAFRVLSLLPLNRFEVRHAAIFLQISENRAERLLEALVDAQLVEANDEARYRYHDLLKLFARERCEQSGDDPNGALAARFLSIFTSDFLESYRESLLTSHWSEVRAEGLIRDDLLITTPDALYVPPRLASINGDLNCADWQNAVTVSPRLLAVGGPGAGKTVLADRICYEVARDGRLFDAAFNVPLRLRTNRHQSLDRLINDSVRLRHTLDMLPETLELLLHRRRTLIVFDGLDEVTVNERDQAREDIVEFSKMHPEVRVVVTSRPGVPTQKFDESGFAQYRIEPFSAVDVRAYIDKWVAATGALRHGEAPLRAKVTAPDTAQWLSTPLLLAQLVSLYGRFGRLPDGPFDLYEGTYSLLFERRDMYRGIRRSGVDPNTLGGLMCALAYEFVIRPAGTGDMPSDEFRRAVRRALGSHTSRTVEDRGSAEELFALLATSEFPVHPTSESAGEAEPRWTLVRDPFGQYLAARAIASDSGADTAFTSQVVKAVRATGFVEGAAFVAALLKNRRPDASRELATAVRTALGKEKELPVRECMEQILRALG